MNPKLIVNALVVLAGLVLGAIATLPDASEGVRIASATVAAIVIPLGARDALPVLFGLLPRAWQQEIVTVTLTLTAAATTINAAVVQPPVALTVGVSVLLAVGGAIGARSQVTPLANPRDNEGHVLGPVTTSRPTLP